MTDGTELLWQNHSHDSFSQQEFTPRHRQCDLKCQWTVLCLCAHRRGLGACPGINTRSSAIADGPRNASCQLKSCQLPHNSAVRQVLNKSKL